MELRDISKISEKQVNNYIQTVNTKNSWLVLMLVILNRIFQFILFPIITIKDVF